MKIIFKQGKIIEQEIDNISGLIFDLNSEREYLYSLKTEDLLDFLDSLSEYWRTNKEIEKRIGGSLKHLIEFIRKESLSNMLNFALRGNYQILDKFLDLGQLKNVYICQPRGLVVHWLSGNAPLLGLYSIFQSLITKNISLVKASTNAYKELSILLESLNSVKTEKIRGTDLLKTIAVVLISHNDIRNQNKISKAADVRVVWGGHEAIEIINSLKKNIFCEDIIYGPKYSYGVIDAGALKDYKKIAQRLAFDVCTFDQYACSSPHTVFIQESKDVSAEEFAKELARNIDLVTNKFLPKIDNNPQKKMDILTVRTIAKMTTGKVFSSHNTDWTVIYSKEPGLAQACFSRVIYIKPIKNLSELIEFSDRKKQTLGIAIKSRLRRVLIKEITSKGIDRCPKFGEMTLFDSPWDGLFAIDRLVRWVSLSKE